MRCDHQLACGLEGSPKADSTTDPRVKRPDFEDKIRGAFVAYWFLTIFIPLGGSGGEGWFCLDF